MKNVILLAIMVSTTAGAQESDYLDALKSAKKPKSIVATDPNCVYTPEKNKGLDDFVKQLNSGDIINPDDLVNNPYFLDPCFKEHTRKFASSFDALANMASSVSKYKEQELALVTKQSSIYDKLGTKKAPSSKPKSTNKKKYVPIHTASFSSFKKSAVLVGTLLVDGQHVAHISLGGMVLNDVKAGDMVRGVQITGVDYGRVTYKDTGAARKSAHLQVKKG